MSPTGCVCINFFVSRLMVQKLNFVVSQYIHNKQITSWLVRLYDFYSLVAKNHLLTRSYLARSFMILHNSWIKIVRTHQPWSNLYMFHKRFINFAIGTKEKYFKIHPDLRWILCSLCAYLLNNSAYCHRK